MHAILKNTLPEEAKWFQLYGLKYEKKILNN